MQKNLTDLKISGYLTQLSELSVSLRHWLLNMCRLKSRIPFLSSGQWGFQENKWATIQWLQQCITAGCPLGYSISPEQSGCNRVLGAKAFLSHMLLEYVCILGTSRITLITSILYSIRSAWAGAVGVPYLCPWDIQHTQNQDLDLTAHEYLQFLPSLKTDGVFAQGHTWPSQHKDDTN